MQKKKSSADAMLKGNVYEAKTTKEEDEYVPLKPLSNPRLAWGNVVLEVDDEDYHRGWKT